MARESSASALQERFARLAIAQEFYQDFPDFLRDAMAVQGFETTDQQLDIANYLSHGPQKLMVQAGRGEAKSTIAVCYGLWCLIHSPAHRVVTVSATEGLAKQMTTLSVRLLNSLPALECMRPDRSAGDLTSSTQFDLHHTLKGVDKSPSLSCFGVFSQFTGNRADLIILDDIETPSNSTTAVKRATLLERSTEFGAIVGRGRQVWLGTPQTTDSIYNTLPSRGVDTRIWPARYPTDQELPIYGNSLSPRILKAIAEDPSLQTGGGINGACGKPTDPQLLGEDMLCGEQLGKEEFFQLNYMLNTAQNDALRYPLKTRDIIVLPNTPTHLPLHITRAINIPPIDFVVGNYTFKLSPPHSVSNECSPISSTVVYIDPAGGGVNGDETAFAVGALSGNSVYILGIGGVGGGYDPDNLRRLAQVLAEFKPGTIIVEKNMGHGAFSAVFRPIMFDHHPCVFSEHWVSSNKESRIIDTLGPVMGRGSLVFTRDAVEQDIAMAGGQLGGRGQSRSVFHQIAFLTKTRSSLLHDDRVDALAGLVNHLTAGLAHNQDRLLESARHLDYLLASQAQLEADRLDLPYSHRPQGGRVGNILNLIRRAFK